MKKQKLSRFFLGFVKVTGILPALLLFKPKVYCLNENCKRRLPKSAILMSNHLSLLDFVLYLVTFPFRTIRFLMSEVLFSKTKVFSWFLYKLGGIFVDRDVCNFSFIEDSLEVLDKNGIVGIFPQGRLPVDGKSFPYKSGIVLVALRTDAPIVPVYTDGNYGIFKRTHIMIGEKIHLRDFVSSENVSDDEIKRLTKMLEDKNYELKAELEKRMNKANGEK